MSFINFSKANCKNCYKCLRSCPVKAIKVNNEQAEIIEERCISCGQCLVVCPQNARNIKGDLEIVKVAIQAGKKVVVSLAPSFPGAFPQVEEEKIVAALLKLGFSIVEETAVGADVVAELYGKYIEEGEYENLITTCCPSSEYLVQKYFPSLIKYLIPIVSPMIAHGKILKETYGQDSFTVFIGPCVAKKFEAADPQYKGSIDAVLTFDELAVWIEREEISLEKLEKVFFKQEALTKGKSFPIYGKVLSSFIENINKTNMETTTVTGIERCIELFKAMENGDVKGLCVEVSACRGSCIGGPAMPKNDGGFYEREKKVKEYCKNKKSISESTSESSFKLPKELNFGKQFFNKKIEKTKASEEEIKKILRDMGKHFPEKELNCGVCGYDTCRAKAQAVYEGMSEINVCLDFMRSQAESLTNIIFRNSPNMIIIIDEEMKIKEINPTAQEIFMVNPENIKGNPLSILIDDGDFQEVIRTKKSIIGKKIAYPQYNVVLIENIIYMENHNIVLAIMNNVMAEEKNKKELLKVKENTLNAAQQVIEKQMRVAQEIASLLGETTAETKIILTKLRKIAMGEDGESK